MGGSTARIANRRDMMSVEALMGENIDGHEAPLLQIGSIPNTMLLPWDSPRRGLKQSNSYWAAESYYRLVMGDYRLGCLATDVSRHTMQLPSPSSINIIADYIPNHQSQGWLNTYTDGACTSDGRTSLRSPIMTRTPDSQTPPGHLHHPSASARCSSEHGRLCTWEPP